MKKIIVSITTILALATSSYAGGKILAPAVTPVEPIPPEVVVPVVAPVTINPIPIYVGLGFMALTLDRDPCPCTPEAPDIEDSRNGGIIRAGWDFNPYIGLEARALKTFENNVFSETEHYGVYLKPQYHITPQMNVYGLLGYGTTTIDYTNGVRSSTTDESGFSYGAGFEYDFGSDESAGTYSRAFDGQGDQEQGWGMWIDVQHLLSDAGAVHTTSYVVTGGITYDF